MGSTRNISSRNAENSLNTLKVREVRRVSFTLLGTKFKFIRNIWIPSLRRRKKLRQSHSRVRSYEYFSKGRAKSKNPNIQYTLRT